MQPHSQRSRGASAAPRNYQPFRQTPSSQGRGGGRSISFRAGPIVPEDISEDIPEDIPKASLLLLDLPPKRDRLNPSPSTIDHCWFQTVPSREAVDQQIVPKDIHLALVNLGLDTSIQKQSLPFAGRLQHFHNNWKLLTQDQFILQAVTGVVIPFQETPYQGHIPSPQFHNQQERELIQNEIETMLEKSAIQVVSPQKEEFISSVFLVTKKDGGNRLIINLKNLNSYITYQHFKLKGLHLLKQILQKWDLMVKIDLKDAYFCVPMHKKHRHFLRFMWEGKCYQFNCLPFSLGPAPLMFTKLLKPVVALLCRLGLRLIVYLDDIILFTQTPNRILQDRDTTLWLLQQLGFVINWKKSV